MNTYFTQFSKLSRILAVCLTLLCSCTVLAKAGFSELPVRETSPELPPLKTILLLGESLSSGYGVKLNDTWMTHLNTQIEKELEGWKLVNISMPSYTVRNATRNIESQLKEYGPALVLIQLGNNDALRASAVRDIQADMIKLIAKIKAQNIPVMIIGSSITKDLGENYSKRFLAMHQKLALSEKTGLVPDLLAEVSSDKSKLTSDSIHANLEGHKQMFKNAWTPIKDYIRCIASGADCAFTLAEKTHLDTPQR